MTRTARSRNHRTHEPEKPVPPHILIVEDNEHVTTALQIMLETVPWRVSVADTIGAALAVTRNDPPSVALLDLTLPDGDGLVLVEPLLASGATRIVVLTGHDDRETRQRCLDAGCADVLVKPISVRDLIDRSRGWIAELQ
jgi:DNA-binding response OmpR family regulator